MSSAPEARSTSSLPPGMEELESHGIPDGFVPIWYGQRRVPSETPAVFSEVTEVTGLVPEGRPPHPPTIFREDPEYPERLAEYEKIMRERRGLEGYPIAPKKWDGIKGIWDEKRDGAWPVQGEEPSDGWRKGVGPVTQDHDFRSDEGDIGRSAVETFAFYYPWHIGGNQHWGIYFRTRKMQERVARFERELNVSGLRDLIWMEVLQHEMEHFEQERALTVTESLLGIPLLGTPFHGAGYQLGFGQNHGKDGNLPPDDQLGALLVSDDGSRGTQVALVHEALATARQVEWAAKQAERGLAPADYPEMLEEEILSDALPGYRDFELCRSASERGRARASFLGIQTFLGFFGRGGVEVPQADSLGTGVRKEFETPGRRAADRVFGSRAGGKTPDFAKGLKTYAGVPLYEITF